MLIFQHNMNMLYFNISKYNLLLSSFGLYSSSFCKVEFSNIWFSIISMWCT